MAIFFSDSERNLLSAAESDSIFCGHKQALFDRVLARAKALGADGNTTTTFWHNIAEYLGDAAFAAAVSGDEVIKNYVRLNALTIADLPEDSWLGPSFRPRPAVIRGHLETAHLSIALSLALDLCPDAFSSSEYAHCAEALKKHAIPLCHAWLDTKPHFLNNWNAVLTCGIALPAAVLGLKDELEFCSNYLEKLTGLLQSDGTYGEGLQYGNYFLWTFLLANEAVMRSGYRSVAFERAGKYLEYCHYNLLTNKPLSNWGAYDRPRSFNFDDSTAIFCPNPDLLALLGTRLENMPQHAALARQIMERFYSANFSQGPFDRTSFGFVPRAGWLSLLFIPQMTKDTQNTPSFEHARAFKNGEAVIRTGNWSKNSLAVALKAPAPEPLNSAGHRHFDFNSIQLFFGNERLLIDPGHTCYRSLTRPLDTATENHSTCTFLTCSGKLSQRQFATRKTLADGSFGDPVAIPGKLEFCGSCGSISAIVSEAAACYGEPIKLFRRTVLVCGENAVFVIDDIDTAEEVKTSWTWSLNNRDGLLNYSSNNNKITARRGNAGLAIFNCNLNISSPRYGFMHDAYHPEVDAPGRGNAGTALHAGHQEKDNLSGLRRNIFMIAADFYGKDSLWQAEEISENSSALFNGSLRWQITLEDDGFVIAQNGRNTAKLIRKEQTWQFIEL